MHKSYFFVHKLGNPRSLFKELRYLLIAKLYLVMFWLLARHRKHKGRLFRGELYGSIHTNPKNFLRTYGLIQFFSNRFIAMIKKIKITILESLQRATQYALNRIPIEADHINSPTEKRVNEIMISDFGIDVSDSERAMLTPGATESWRN